MSPEELEIMLAANTLERERLERENARLDKECGEYLDRIQKAHEEEREACAKIVYDAAKSPMTGTIMQGALVQLANAIMARK